VTDWLPAERPRSVRETLQGRIVALVRGGTYPHVAAATVGIERHTFRQWLERGAQKPRSREGRFVRALAEAEGLLETVLVQGIVAEARKDPEMALKFLERRHPDRWRRATALEHTGPGGGPVEHRILWDMGPRPIETTATSRDEEA
jgi:transposase